MPVLDGALALSFLARPVRVHTRTLTSKLIKPLDNEVALITVTLLSPYLGLAGITTQKICSERTVNMLSRATPDIIKISHWEGKY